MKCQKCGLDFPENEIDVSHDVPVYMFSGEDRKERKNKADKWGRHNLCKKCHDIYERIIFSIAFNTLTEDQKEKVRKRVKEFSINYFKKEGENGSE